MKKFMLILCLTFFPFFSHADELVIAQKKEILTYLIYHTEYSKYNCYIFHALDPSSDVLAYHIVKNCFPVPLPMAQKLFPKYNLKQENYGFNRHESIHFSEEYFYPIQHE